MSKENRVIKTISISKTLSEQIKEYAKKEMRNETEVIRYILTKFFDKNETN